MNQSDIKTPGVSIVIPAYRAAHTIARAVTSVLAQTSPAAEIVIVDDGSPDDLAAALAPFADRITLLRKENGGAASARNAGIELATGEFIAFLDADDYWEPHKLERQSQVFLQHPEVGLVAGQYFAEPPGAERAVGLTCERRWFDQTLVLTGEPAFRAATIVWTGTVLVRREVLADERFVSGLEPAEDRDLWARLVKKKPCYLLSEPLATAVLEPGSLSRSNVDRDCGNMLRVIHRHRDLLGLAGLRRWEADTYRRWAAGHLGAGRPKAAVVPAGRRLVREPWRLQAWWIVCKSLAWHVSAVWRTSRRGLRTATLLAGMLAAVFSWWLRAVPPPAQQAVGADLGSSGRPELGVNASLHGRRPFPDDNPWNTPIDDLPVDKNSATYLASIGLDKHLHPDFGYSKDGLSAGIPYVVVGKDQPKSAVLFDYPDESDGGPYPIPADPPIEGGAQSNGDRHILMVDRDAWKLYELFAVRREGGKWKAGSGAVFDLNSNKLRPAGWTSADAAGLPIFPGLVRYDEVVEQTEIRHALRFTVRKTRRAYISPARHWASRESDAGLPPMGLRVRLKSSYEISGFPPNVQVILKALKKYGMLLADNGGDWFITGAPDARWDDAELAAIKRVKGLDLEVVETSRIVTQ